MKFITMEHLRRFDSLAATWNDSYADKPRSALALADDGAFVFEKVLEAVAPLVEEAHKAGIAAAEARLKKHTAVYADFSKGLAPGQQA